MPSDHNTKYMTIEITNLRVRAIIGIFDWERKNKQDLVINLKIKYDAQGATFQDNIKHALDYKKLCKKIINFIENSSYNLIETLCEEISDLVLENDQVIHTNIRVAKPQALRFADSVSVSCEKYANTSNN